MHDLIYFFLPTLLISCPLSSEEEWEKELEAELQDFEVVSDGDKKGTDAQWETQIEEMLVSADLK